MRILFVSTNRLKVAMPPMPLGLASVIAQVDASRHRIEVLDMMFSEQPENELVKQISDFNPEVIAISVRNLDNQSYLSTDYLLPKEKEVIDLCRKTSEAKIVIGGPAVTVSPQAIFEYLRPDFAVNGEGDRVFPELVGRLENGDDFTDLPGLVWKGSAGTRMNPQAFIPNLDMLNPPRRDLFDNERYARERSMANIVIKQGCEFNCLYCDSPHVMGNRWRMKSPETVAAELETMQNEFGVKLAYFTDAIFNYPVDHARAICQAIIDRNLKIRWVATINPAYTDRPLLELMQKAGCVVASPSCDSCSEKMLRSLQKNFNQAQLKTCLELLEEMEISYMLSILIGGPGENRDTVQETVSFLEERTPMMVDFCVGIRLMPHSPLFDIAVEEGIISADDPLMEPKFYISPDIMDWIEEYLIQVSARYERWSVKQR